MKIDLIVTFLLIIITQESKNKTSLELKFENKHEELNKKIEDELKIDSQMERLIKYLPGIEEIIGYPISKI